MKRMHTVIIGLAAAVCFASVSCLHGADLIIDLDAYDNLSEAHAYGAEYYGPSEVRDFFADCRKHGVSTVFWRSHCQVAAYYSRWNYDLGDELSIRSQPDALRHDGAFAAKVDVNQPGGGISQTAATETGGTYVLGAWCSAPPIVG